MKSPRYLVPNGTYMADPAAHVFNGRLYIYPSHDIESGIPENDLGDHFDMRDYHVLSMDSIDGEVKDLKNGSKAAQGACPVCGTKMTRMLPKSA